MIRIRSNDPSSLGSYCIKENDESFPGVDFIGLLLCKYPSDFESSILIRIIPKERTQNVTLLFHKCLPKLTAVISHTCTKHWETSSQSWKILSMRIEADCLFYVFQVMDFWYGCVPGAHMTNRRYMNHWALTEGVESGQNLIRLFFDYIRQYQILSDNSEYN